MMTLTFKPVEYLDNMKVFRKMLKSHEYFDYVSPPNMYCPLPWWNTKEIYYSDTYKEKYGVKNQTNDEMINSAISIHCWNNIRFGR